MKIKILLVALLVLTTSGLAMADDDKQGTMFWGGWLGVGFGNVEYYEFSPLVGFYPLERVATGIRLTYRYRNDERYTPQLRSNDYGAGVFARFYIIPSIFLQGEYDYLSYDYITRFNQEERGSDTRLMGGAGFSTAVNDHISVSLTGLYDFLYDEDDLYSAYGSPWVIRGGIGFGF